MCVETSPVFMHASRDLRELLNCALLSGAYASFCVGVVYRVEVERVDQVISHG